MERILVILAFFFCLSAIGATPGNAPILTIAAPWQQTEAVSIPLSSLSGTGVNGVFTLYAGQNMTSTDFYILYKNGAAYATGASTKAYCFNNYASSGSTSSTFQFVSSQTAFSNGASSITSGTYQGGSNQVGVSTAGNTAYLPAPIPGIYVFGDGVHVTYAGVQVNASAYYSFQLQCIEM